jgi:peptidoglycan/xylan/chitin deacetylase (PgdA/CDA1 family)
MIPGAPWAGPGAIPILMYHFVTNKPPADELDWSLTVTEPDFARQVSYLRCAGYYSITLSQLFDAMHGGAPLPEKPVILTFDDGYKDAYTNAFPLLRSAGLAGTFGIVTDWVGQPDYMNWDQLREMAAGGMEIVSHSVNHPDLGREYDAVVRDQLSRSKQVLEQQLGFPIAFFIYPAGEPFRVGTAERQAQVVTMVQEAGYRGALTTRPNMWQDPFAPYALSRVRVSGGTDIHAFAANMWGPPPDQIGC